MTPGPQMGRDVVGGRPGVCRAQRRGRGEGGVLGSGFAPLWLHWVNLGYFLALLGLCFLLCEWKNLH